MDELKLLIEMVSNLPSLAVWVLVGYLVYKVVVIGSIYGLARFGVEKLHSWAMRDKVKDVRLVLDGVAWGSGKAEFVAQLHRIVGLPDTSHGYYINTTSAEWLQKAIDDKIAKDNASKPQP